MTARVNVANGYSLGNKLLQDNKLDNKLLTEEPDRCAAVIGLALNHLALLASIVAPYMPGTSKAMFLQLDTVPSPRIPDTWETDLVKPGHRIGTPALLFTQIPAAKAEEWREAYGGEELRKAKELAAQKAAEKKAQKEREKEKKKAKKTAEAAAKAAGSSVEASIKAPVADPEVGKVAEALGKTDMQTS